MKRFYFIIVMWLATFFSSGELAGRQVASVAVPNVYVDSIETAKRVLFLTYSEQYNEALALVERMADENPSSIQWKYFHAIILWRKLRVQSWATGYHDEVLVNRIGNELLTLKKLIDEVPDSLRAKPYYLFYAGAIYGYLGMYYAGIREENLKAIKVGGDGLNYYKKILQIDTTCYDAYYSFGVYHFYASDAPWYIKPLLWVFGVSGSEEKADTYLTLAAKKSTLAKYEAMEMLAELYVRRRLIDSAVIVYRKLIQKFPSAYYYYLNLGWVYKKFQRIDEMANVYQEGVNYSRKTETIEGDKECLSNIYLLLGSYYSRVNRVRKAITLYQDGLARNLGHFDWWCYRIALCYEKLGDKTQAIYYYKLIRGGELTTEEIQRVQSRLNELAKDSQQ